MEEDQCRLELTQKRADPAVGPMVIDPDQVGKNIGYKVREMSEIRSRASSVS